ncbi:MAG: glycosyltransferase family A protein [Pseudomonadota bacterium]
MKSVYKIAVIIPVFNRRQWIRRAVDSVLSQTFSNENCTVECIVVDDASKDGTPELLEEVYGSKITLIRVTENAGQGAARNRGVKESTSEFITFLDSDDILTPLSLQHRLDVFLKDSLFDGVAFGLRRENHFEGKEFHNDLMQHRSLSLAHYLENTIILHTNAFMLRRHHFAKVGFYNPNLRRSQDIELFIRLLMTLPFYYCGHILTEILPDANNRIRSNHSFWLERPTAISTELLSSTSSVELTQRQIDLIQKYEFRQHLNALYKTNHYAIFAEKYLAGMTDGKTPLEIKYAKRFLISQLLRWFPHKMAS